jgi:lysozyme
VNNGTFSKAKSLGGAAVVAAVVAFTPMWEGTDYVAKRDAIGTGHPITWCHGQTNGDRGPQDQVKVGQRFTKQECDAELQKSIEQVYLPEIAPCVTRPVPVKVMAALIDGGYNAGSARICGNKKRGMSVSPMLAKINAGDFKGGCEAFDGWIVRSDGVVRTGLIDRRSGELHGDHRKSERALCLEGANDPKSEMYSYTGPVSEPTTGPYLPPAAVPPPKPQPVTVHKHHILKPHVVVCTGALFWRECK